MKLTPTLLDLIKLKKVRNFRYKKIQKLSQFPPPRSRHPLLLIPNLKKSLQFA